MRGRATEQEISRNLPTSTRKRSAFLGRIITIGAVRVVRCRLFKVTFAFLLLLMGASGCAALIYEIVWLQLLQLVIGSSAASLGLLLAAYMGGLCAGSALLARFVTPERHPLRVYAVLEAGIGALGLTVLFGVPLVGHLYAAGPAGLITRALVATVCLVPPTLLMGA